MITVNKMSRISQFLRSTLDTSATLWRDREPAPRDGSAGRSLRGVYCLVGVAVMTLSSTPSQANQSHWYNDTMNLKLYAINQSKDWNEALCFIEVIHRESSWNYKAVSPSGKHYGLGQMKSKWYKGLSPRRMIDASIKYYVHRYGSSCNALTHMKEKGWT